VLYSNKQKTVFRYDPRGMTYIIASSPHANILARDTQLCYNWVAMHEMGHMLGWAGHSSNNTDIMHATVDHVTLSSIAQLLLQPET